MKRQLEFEKECRLLNIDINSAEAQQLRKTCNDANNNVTNAFATNNEVMLLIFKLNWYFLISLYDFFNGFKPTLYCEQFKLLTVKII